MSKKSTFSLLKNTYTRLRPSPIGGVGVFAVRDIPAGINPFPGSESTEWHRFTINELKDLDLAVMKMVEDFFVLNDDEVYIPDSALNGINISFFVNNSDSPNLKTTDDGYTFKTARHIKAGEELVVAYETYDDSYKK